MVRFFSCTNVARLPSGLIEIYNVSVCCGCVECVLVLYMYLYNYIVCVIVCMQLYYCEESVWPLSGAMTMKVREGSETSMGEIIRIIHVNHWCYLNWLKLPIASAKWNEYTLVYFCQFSLFLRCVNVRMHICRCACRMHWTKIKCLDEFIFGKSIFCCSNIGGVVQWECNGNHGHVNIDQFVAIVNVEKRFETFCRRENFPCHFYLYLLLLCNYIATMQLSSI